MNRMQILIIGSLPMTLQRALSHVVEIVKPSDLNHREWEPKPYAQIARPLEAWQEKPNRNAGFASARRLAKKRRKHG